MNVDYLIIGAGPTGLGAACRLQEHGEDWLMVDALPHVGGLASSWVDDNGFTWDHGGHVQFSHYETFDRYMLEALGEDGWLEHQRESWVWIKQRFVPYPFQNNLHRLDPADRWAAVEGLMKAAKEEGATKPSDFDEWMMATFGEGITELFMRPYNFKVWAFPPREMDYGWIGERVSVPPIKQVLQSVCTNEDAVSWGPNAVFMFPKHGGTGGVWTAIGDQLPQERVKLSNAIQSIDTVAKTVIDQQGNTIGYQHLISTIPLNHLIKLAPGVVAVTEADRLVYSATNIVGVGITGAVPEHLKTKCWMYFPDDNSPYYRVTVFSNYSPNNVPQPGAQWSLMTETSESTAKPVDHDTLVAETIRALKEDQLLPEDADIASTTYRRIDQGYPTPFVGRDAIVDPALRAFEAVDIYSRGRFGAWKYEVANQDHSFAQGYECVERLRQGGGAELEPTVHNPPLVNSRKNA
jgi:protoporphyrinogen oxidase